MDFESRLKRLESWATSQQRPWTTMVLLPGEEAPPDAGLVVRVQNEHSKALTERILAGEGTE